MGGLEELVAFLDDRLTEDRELVLQLREGRDIGSGQAATRLEAKVESQVALVALLRRVLAGADEGQDLPTRVLTYLASAYRRHPDFRPEWFELEPRRSPRGRAPEPTADARR